MELVNAIAIHEKFNVNSASKAHCKIVTDDTETTRYIS